MLPELAEEVETSADPPAVSLAIERILASQPDVDQRLADDPDLRRALVAVAAASPWLGRVCATDPRAIDVLSRLDDRPDFDDQLGFDYPADLARFDLARFRRLEVLRIAARDLTNIDGLERVTGALSELADSLLGLAQKLTTESSTGLAVIAMGKLGARELNYSSDIDLLLVSPADGSDPRPLLALARQAFRIDLDLRPEGRAGPLTRTLQSYLAYWDRWAEPWEFQALLKARAAAGDPDLGRRFEDAAAERVWGRPLGSEELGQLRHLKGRAEESLSRRGLAERELKQGKGGLRDIEFALQLLQLVHGRADSSLRQPSTISALRALAAGGYIGGDDAAALEEAYRWLRAVEHRLQLQEDQQVHAVPPPGEARQRLARILGYRDRGYDTALGRFESDLRRHQATVRRIHERLFFRPLLEAFSAPTTAATPLGKGAISERLAAFGFTDANRTLQAVRELTRGFSRGSQLMQQMLPLLLDWLSDSPDPDLGLVGLRTLATTNLTNERLITVCRESPEGARELCLLLGTVRSIARELQRHPELLTGLVSGEVFNESGRAQLDEGLARSLVWRGGPTAVEAGLRLFAGAERARIACRDVLGRAGSAGTARALTNLAEAVIAAAFKATEPSLPFCVVGMGRLGGRELGYSSDLDLMFVYDVPAGVSEEAAAEEAEAAVARLVRLIAGDTPATGIYKVDTALRPEGRQGPRARSLAAFEAYYAKWAEVWERQALLRGRFLTGDEDLGARFAALVEDFVWSRPFGDEDARAVRRTKARMERERIPPGEDPQFHLKLGPGSLSDVEWTAQLLQLQHGVRAEGTIDALEQLAKAGAMNRDDCEVLSSSWRFCERARNRLALVSDAPDDYLPSPGSRLTALARSMGTTSSGLRDEFRRHTRRARRVVERVFYGEHSSDVR